MSTANGITESVRNVYTLDDRIETHAPMSFPIDEGVVRRMFDTLQAGGLDVAELSNKFETAMAATHRGATAVDPNALDLLSLDGDSLTALVRSHGLTQAAGVHVAQASHMVSDAIARQTAEALMPNLDEFVKTMRPEFAKAVAVVTKAHETGLTADTTAASIAETGSPQQIATFRSLPEHVATLDRIAATRTELTRAMRYGPTDWECAAFVTSVPDRAALESAHSVFQGPSEPAQYNGALGASSIITVKTRRLGGAWLALVAAGFTLRLNNGDEAASVVSSAFARS